MHRRVRALSFHTFGAVDVPVAGGESVTQGGAALLAVQVGGSQADERHGSSGVERHRLHGRQ